VKMGTGASNVRIGSTKRALTVLSFGLCVSACVQIAGIEEPTLGDPNGDGGMGANSSSTGGMGGGGAGGNAGSCVPLTQSSCYSGPAETANVGNCKTGSHRCFFDGSGYGPCEGEVVPQMENCITTGDEDCDGYIDLDDPECLCNQPGASVSCDTGQPGVCTMGMGTCSNDGRFIDNCVPIIPPSPENCATPDDENCDGSEAPPCSGIPQWSRTQGLSMASMNDDIVFATAAYPDGSWVIAGMVDGTLSADGYGVTAGTIFVAKVDDNGTFLWEKRYPATTLGAARGVAVDPAGNIIVVGEFEGTVQFDGANNVTSANNASDIFMLKLDSAGQYTWHKVFSTLNQQMVMDVGVDAAGNIYITGSATIDVIDFGGQPFDPAGEDVYLAKFGSNGQHLWSNLYVNTGSQRGRQLAVMPNGDVVIIGDTDGDTNLGGGIIVKGGNRDFFVARYAGTDGSYMWGKLFGGVSDQFGRDIAVGADGSILITGGFTGSIFWGIGANRTAVGTSDLFVAQLNPATGDHIQNFQAGKPLTTAIGTSLGSDAAGNVTVFGHFNGSMDVGGQTYTSSSGSFDTFLVKLRNTDWSPVWTKQYGKAGNQYASSVTVKADGSALVGGAFYTELEVPPNAIVPSVGGADLFVVRTNP